MLNVSIFVSANFTHQKTVASTPPNLEKSEAIDLPVIDSLCECNRNVRRCNRPHFSFVHSLRASAEVSGDLPEQLSSSHPDTD